MSDHITELTDQILADGMTVLADGWSKGALCDDQGHTCAQGSILVGAEMAALRGEKLSDVETALRDASERVRAAVRERSDYTSVETANDANETSLEDVLLWFKDARARTITGD